MSVGLPVHCVDTIHVRLTIITECSGPCSQTTFVTRGSFLVRVGGCLGFAATVYIWNSFSSGIYMGITGSHLITLALHQITNLMM